MVKCNNNYVCEEDAVTFDEITDASKCVAIADNVCTTCDTISGARSSNPQTFNKDPIYAVFAKKSNEQETESFWDTLDEKCDIKRPATHGQKEEPVFYVIDPDYDDVDQSTAIVLLRINKLRLNNTNAYRFLNTINAIANSPRTAKHIIQMDRDGSAYMRYLRDLLESDKCSSKLIHHANELPIGIGLFLHQLANSKNSGFIKVVQFLNKNPSACIEAVIEECTSILSRTTSSKSKPFKRAKTLKRAKSFTRKISSKFKRKSTIKRRQTI